MPHINVGKEHAAPIEMYYEDHGNGRPVLLISGWPLDSRSWEKQIAPLVDAGHRVVAYDRRGFGNSSRTLTGYDYVTLANDVRRLLLELDLHDVTLVGFSMGGGEVARYCGEYGSERIAGAVFVSAVTPFLLKTAGNPEGVDPHVFSGIIDAIAADRPAFLAGFLQDFFNVDKLRGERISDRAVEFHWNAAVNASPAGTRELVSAWSGTDFRADLARIDVPTLIVHGDADRTVPLAVSAQRTHAAVSGSELVTLAGAPHGLIWTHAAEFNAALLNFLGRSARGRSSG